MVCESSVAALVYAVDLRIIIQKGISNYDRQFEVFKKAQENQS